MKSKKNRQGFTLIEVIVAVAVFMLFALGIYEALMFTFKAVYQSRISIIETALLTEQLEVIRGLPYASVGIKNGIPNGVLDHVTTTIRNGINFSLTITVRNVDDPFDGMATGTIPIDTAPADYKIVEISAQCASCSQQSISTISTTISPKNLEGATGNGALFINVFDANGLPVVGANVHVVDTAPPNVIVDDLTGNDGYLRIVDAPTGTQSYSITVTKPGYSTDFTTSSSASNPSPIKQPANIVSQTVTDISFQIDKLGSITTHTIDPFCVAIPNIGFNLSGSKLIGTPNVKKYSKSFITDGGGNITIPNLEWDSPAPPKGYDVTVTGTHDLSGSISQLPLALEPGMNQNLSLILSPHTANSLLVRVRDAGTGLPLSDANIELSKAGYLQTIVTGLGYVRQTDWSGGPGQIMYTDPTKYFGDSVLVDVNSSPGDVKIKMIAGLYANSGYLESSTFDLGQPVALKNLVILPTSQPPQTGLQSVLFQVALSNSSTPSSWNFVGPDGTSSTFYSVTSTIIYTGGLQYQYLRYRLFLSTDDQNFTPQFSELAITFSNSCVAPGQGFFSGLSFDTYNLKVTRSGYLDSTTTVDVSGQTQTSINLSSF